MTAVIDFEGKGRAFVESEWMAFLVRFKAELEATAPSDSGRLRTSFHIEGAGLDAKLVNDSGYMPYLDNLRDGRTADQWVQSSLERASR